MSHYQNCFMLCYQFHEYIVRVTCGLRSRDLLLSSCHMCFPQNSVSRPSCALLCCVFVHFLVANPMQLRDRNIKMHAYKVRNILSVLC